MTDALMKLDAAHSPLPHKDYTLALLHRAALNGSIPAERLEALKTGLYEAVSERAAAYTRGRSTTVTQAQAEAFYVSVLTQLDTALLMQCADDAEAEEKLRTEPLSALLAYGQQHTLLLYEDAKQQFRQAYRDTKPVMTRSFHALLPDFEQFCTKYDARFRANATKVDFHVYPLLSGTVPAESGILGVQRYYAALRLEGTFLRYFEADAVNAVMQRYADKFLTARENIAENIAELIFRHWLLRALCGEKSFAAAVTAEMTETVSAEYGAFPAEKLTADMQRLTAQAFADAPTLSEYLCAALPALSAQFISRMENGRLNGIFSILSES